MNQTWWSLPGPAAFIEDMVLHVRRGNHVVLALPDHVPPGIDTACKRGLGEAWPWIRLDATMARSPDAYLNALLSLDIEDTPPTTAEVLLTHSELKNRVFWIHLMDRQKARDWVAFLETYRVLCHGRGSAGPPQFVIALQGEALAELPREDALRIVRSWKNSFTPLDALLYASRRCAATNPGSLQAQVTTATCAAFALWDAELADSIAHDPEAFLKAPLHQLLGFAQRRSWSPEEEPCWEKGQVGFYAGEERIHVAWHAIRGDHAEIQGRLWEAQITVLFPFLEQRRRQLIDVLGASIPMPWSRERDGRSEMVEYVSDLEFHDFLGFLQETPGNHRELIDVVRRLKTMRNRLAHYQALDVADLDYPFTSMLRRLLAEVMRAEPA